MDEALGFEGRIWSTVETLKSRERRRCLQVFFLFLEWVFTNVSLNKDKDVSVRKYTLNINAIYESKLDNSFLTLYGGD